MSKETFYVTTPIYYVNDVPHIGHSYTTIAADVLARYYRLIGRDVFFLTGTDEHGVKIQHAAEKARKSPQQFCDEIAQEFKKAWQSLGIKYDNFIRTTDSHHERVVQEVLQRLYDEGYIYKGRYEALYCVGCEQYKTKSDLIDGKCPDHKTESEVRMEESYLFKLSSFQKPLLKLIKEDRLKIKPLERKNEMVSFLESEELLDVSISREKEKVYWGIPLPFDTSHTTYVWVDAFLNYLTGLGWPENERNFQKFWPPDIQLMAKDILRVHATIWIAILMALGLQIPQEYFIHGYFTVNGDKMSKSLRNVIDPIQLSEKYGADVVRYFILAEFPFGTDGDFSIKRLEETYNSDLANDLGNLLHRTIPMMEKYFQNVVPEPGELGVLEKELREAALETATKIKPLFNELSFRDVLTEIWKLINKANKYIDTRAPWALAREEKQDELRATMYTLAETIRIVALLISPFMPETAGKILAQLGIEKKIEESSWDDVANWAAIKPATLLTKEKPLFPRIISS